MMASTSQANQHQKPAEAPTVLQWNCRGLQQSAPELNFLFAKIGYPRVLLLQETHGTATGIRQYTLYFNPAIAHKHKRGDAETRVVAQAAVAVHNSIPQTRINTDAYCNSYQEVVAVRCQIGMTKVIVVSVYLRPNVSARTRGNFTWIRDLQTRYPGERLLAAGDFNAHHPHWGYEKSSIRGEHLLEAMERAGLMLVNDLDFPTRQALHTRQKDTTPDLTWATQNLVTDWHCQADLMGSDHHPIWIQLATGPPAKRKKKRSITDWSHFRVCLRESATDLPIDLKIKRACREASRDMNLRADVPTPDAHLLHLWDRRAEWQARYLEHGRRYRDLLRVRRTTAAARRYARQLYQERWLNHCATFDERTSLAKLWSTFRAIGGRRKSSRTTEDILLATGLNPLEFQDAAASTFFPQPDDPPDESIYRRVPVAGDTGINAPFSMAELSAALQGVNTNGSPGKDGITWTAIRNLDEDSLQQLLNALNTTWMKGEIPPEWKHSVVAPIPKPGKTPDRLEHLRPISLTSTLCKLLERMVHARISHHLETTGWYHPFQTGFRSGLSTQDSLYLLRRTINKTHRGKRRGPDVIVAVDLKRAFDTVTHEAVIGALEESGITGRPLNFVKSFLENRTFEIRTPGSEHKTYTNRLGVPQGAIVSPTLFNVVMARLAKLLSCIDDLHFTIYADDITIWTTHTHSLQDQATILQSALDCIADFLPFTGMRPSPDKTQFLVIHGDTNDTIALTFAGEPIRQSETGHIRILGIPIDRTGTASTWITQLIPTWRKMLHLVRRISWRMGGAGTDTARLLVRAVLISRAAYGAIGFNLTAAHLQKLERLHNEALRAVTGLPRHARLEDLQRYARLPPLSATIAARKESDNLRRNSTRQGRQLLRTAGETPDPALEPQDEQIPPGTRSRLWTLSHYHLR